MADKRLDVLTRFRADTGGLDRSMRRSSVYADQLRNRINGITGAIARTAGTALGIAGFGGVGFVIAKTAKDMVGLNRELETAQIGIASVLQNQSAGGKGPFESWETSLSASNLTMRELEKRAAALPGTTAEFRRGFELLLPLTSRAGKSIEDTIGLAERLVVAAKVGNVYGGVETVARDVQQILSGSASIAEINTIALKGRAKEIATLARKDLSAAVREIEKTLRVSPKAMEAFGKTFETQASTMQDAIARFVRTAGSPVFEWVKAKLTEWNGWLSQNEARVKAIAKQIGDGIVKGIKTAGEWAKKLYDRWDDIKAVIRTIAEVWLASKMIGAIGRVTTAISGAGGLRAAIAGLLGPIGLVVAGFETIRMMMADPLGDRAKELGATVVRPENIRREFAAGRMSAEREAFFRARLPESTTSTSVTMRRKGQDYEPVTKTAIKEGIQRASNSLLMQIEQDFQGEKARQRAAGAFKTSNGSFGGLLGKMEGPPVLAQAFDAEKPPTVDARGSTFNFNQKFEEGDPERIFFEIRSSLIRPFLPKLGSTLSPS